MKDKDKTKAQLIRELEELRQQITKLKSSETKHGRIEELLRESESKFRTVFENAGGAIFIVDSETGEISDCNNQAEKLIGRRRDDIIGMHYLKAHHEDEAEKYKEKLNQYVKKGHTVDFEGEVQHMDGRRIPVLLGAQTLKIGGKNMVAGILIDITEKKRTEEELRKTKDHLENIIESSLDSIVVTDTAGYITRVNKAFLQLLGHRKEDVMGKHMAEFSPSKEGSYECTTGELIQINKEFFDVLQTSMSRLVEKGKILNAMGYHIRKDNKLVPVEDSIVSLHNKEGERIGVLGIVRDITERRKAEKIITEGTKFLDRVIESSMDGIAIVDEKGHIISLNTALEKMCQFTREELMGKHISILTIDDKDLRNSILEKTRELFEKGSVRYEAVNITKDDNYINVECNNSLIKNARGNIIAGVSIIRDITDRKKADKKVQETKDFLENIFKTSVDGIMVTDPQSVITMINESLEKMLGYSQDELLGKHTRELTPDEKEYEERTKEFVSTLSEEGVIRGFEHAWMRKDGSLVDIEINVALLKDDKGNIMGSVGSIRDITERKQVEKILIEYQNQLRTLASQLTLTEEQERRKFAESLHDYIGQSLFISKIKLEMLQKSGLSSNSAKPLDETLKLIEQMINDTRSLTFELSPPILYQLGFEPTLEWLIEQIEKQYGIRADFEDDKQLKPLDDDISILLFRAVRELLINVVKHAQAQNVKVSTRRDGDKIQICVEDDGIGFTISKTGLFDFKGKRFGLFSIKERLDQLGGHFKTESTPNHGTRMTMVAPLKLQE